MPLIDMPLEKLREYQGRNPRPADFDEYWDTAIAEMKAVDAQVELRPAAFTTPAAKCFDLYFTGVRGARIHAKLIKPNRIEGKRPAVVQFHGYTGSAGEWFGLLTQAARGYVVAAMDCRGQGGMSEDVGGVRGNTHHGHIIRGLDDAPDKLLFRDIFLDTAQLAGIVMNRGADRAAGSRSHAPRSSPGSNWPPRLTLSSPTTAASGRWIRQRMPTRS
jgi:cephalosporin-C deacetylase